MRLTSLCPICGKILEEIGRINLGSECLIDYKCGHSFASSVLDIKPEELKFDAVDGSGKSLREYQRKGSEFIIESGFNCLLGDQMRLGKTPQVLNALMNRYNERTPCLILVRSANVYQWMDEFKVFCSTLPLGVYPISSTKSFIPPGFGAYVMSMDTFSRTGTCKNCEHAMQRHTDDSSKRKRGDRRPNGNGEECTVKNCNCNCAVPSGDSMVDKLLKFGFKLVIVDEAHSFKNASSMRTRALVSLLHNISINHETVELPITCIYCKHAWTEKVTIEVNMRMDRKEQQFRHSYTCPNCQAKGATVHQKIDLKNRAACGIVMLTGTMIENNAEESFVPLNLIAPERFPSLERFRTQWLQQNVNGKWTRVHPQKLAAFKATIAPYVLRREKEDVFKDLPLINRMFTVITIEDERLAKAYNERLDILEEQYVKNPNLTFFQSIGDLTILRQIAALAKVPWVTDYCETTLEDSKEKIAIGVYHDVVRDSFMRNLAQYGCLKFSGEESPEQKFKIMKELPTSPERVLIVNMKAGGVGCDFKSINTVVITEGEWNFAKEQQFEFRFTNPDKNIKSDPTNIEYIIAKGTIDEYWHDEMRVNKGKIFNETIGTNYDPTQDPVKFKALLEKTLQGRLKI